MRHEAGNRILMCPKRCIAGTDLLDEVEIFRVEIVLGSVLQRQNIVLWRCRGAEIKHKVGAGLSAYRKEIGETVDLGARQIERVMSVLVEVGDGRGAVPTMVDERVVTGAAREQVRAVQIAAAVEAAAAVERIVVGAAVDVIGTEAAKERIVSRTAEKRIVAEIA